jgi:hypothetical protein
METQNSVNTQQESKQQQEEPSAIHASMDAWAGQAGTAELLQNVLQFAGGVTSLAVLETRVAAASLPRYMELGFLKLFMLVCVWLSLSGCLMWLVFLATGSVMTGLLGMTAMQVIAYLVCKKLQDIHLHRLSLPNTRRQLAQLGETINESIKSATGANRAD